MEQINYIPPVITEALTYDDVLLAPQETHVTPDMVSTQTSLSKHLKLDIPILSAAMDTVSEYDMGVAMAQSGGIAVIHRNMGDNNQQAEIIAKLKDNGHHAAAAIGTGDGQLDRAKSLIDAGVDMIVIDTAHGHSINVLKQVEAVRKLSSSITLCAGNIATAKAAQALIDCGVGAVKVGVGPGSICTTRIVAGVGVPQLTAVMNVASVARPKGIAVIADGGLRHSGDIVKALAAGANAVMIGSLLAGTDESPGDIIHINGGSYKAYRGMGSIGAMSEGSADRYFQKNGSDTKKLVAEGVEGLTKAKGSTSDILYQLVGGLRSGMGYIGAETIAEMPSKAEFVKISNAGLKESHVHDLAQMSAAPNYGS
jgi:IMP dehydrogenase